MASVIHVINEETDILLAQMSIRVTFTGSQGMVGVRMHQSCVRLLFRNGRWRCTFTGPSIDKLAPLPSLPLGCEWKLERPLGPWNLSWPKCYETWSVSEVEADSTQTWRLWGSTEQLMGSQTKVDP